MPLDEDAYLAWSTFLDHAKGPEDSSQLACATCDEAVCPEDLCCWGYTLWSAMPERLRKKLP